MAPNPVAEATPAPTPVLEPRVQIVTVMSTLDTGNNQKTEAPPPKKSGKAVIGPIVGGLVGGIAAGVLGALLLWWYIRHRRANKEAIRRAYIRRKQRQLAQYNKARSNYTGSAASSTVGGSSRSTISPPILKTPPMSPTEKDPYGGIAPPLQAYKSPKSLDPYVAEHGYGYEPSQIQYLVPANAQYYVQGGYDPSLLQPNVLPTQFVFVPQQPDVDRRSSYRSSMPVSPGHPAVSPQWSYSSGQQSVSPPSSSPSVSPPSSQSTSPPASRQTSPPSSPPSSSSRRGAQRAAVAEQAAASASAPPTQRHRPSRPSPLSLVGHKREPSTGEDTAFVGPSPFLTPDSSDTAHAYAAAAEGQWGVALGSPEHDRFDFNRDGATEPQPEPVTPTSLPSSSQPQSTDDSHVLRTPSINHDPFAEYAQYAQYADDSAPKRL